MEKITNWEGWKKANNQLWNNSTKIRVDDNNLTNVKALMSKILQRDASPFNKKDIKAFNKQLGNQSMQIQGTSLKSSIEAVQSGNQEYNLQFLIRDDNNKNRQLAFYKNIGNIDKDIITIEPNSLKINIEALKSFIGSEKTTTLEKRYEQIRDKLGSDKFSKDKLSGIKIHYISVKDQLINVFVSNSNDNKDIDETDSWVFQKGKDLIEKLWKESYIPYINDYLDVTRSFIEKELEDSLEKEILNETKVDKRIKGINKDLEKINKETLSLLTYNWVKRSSKEIEKILEQVDFYKDKKFGEKRKEDFLKFFKKQIKDKKLSYYSSKGEYIQSFGGDFGEIDTLIRPKRVFKETTKELTDNVRIELLGKELSKNAKQVPADGKITFNYNGNTYICTFQSKLFKEQTYQKGIYQDKGFFLGYQWNIEKKNKNLLYSNLYAYPNEMLVDDDGYTIIGKEIENKNTELTNSQNYIGSIPGLLRIKSFVSDIEELNRSDFYYFSGYYIPSCYLLNKIKAEKEKWEDTNNLPLEVNIEDNLVVGTIRPFNIYSFLRQLINN